MLLYTGWPKKLAHFVSFLHQILTDFQTYFTVRIRRAFVIIPLLKIPLQLKRVATLPCEMSVSSKQQLKAHDDFCNNTF